MPRLAPLASCLALAASFAGAQEPVVVDAVVTAKSGIVKNLTAKDFKVWDDNKEQTVTAAPLRGPGKHAVVLLFDSTSLSAAKQGDIRGYVASFIDAAANPNLYMEVAVFRTGIQILQPFTNDPALLKASLGATAASSVLNTNTGTTPAPSPVAPPPSAVTRGGIGGGRSLGQGALSDATATGDNTMKSQAMMESLRGLAEGLASVRGRKAIILFTGGQQFSQDAIPQVDEALDAANRADVAIYGVSDDVAFAKTFASGTGGTAIRPTQFLPAALGEIIEEQNSYYAVTFMPPAGAATAACHSLRLKTEGDGTEVRARKLYCPATPASPRLDSILAGQPAGKLNLSVQAPWFYTPATGRARVKVIIEAASSGVKLKKEKGRMRGELDVAAVATSSDGSAAARFSEAVPLEFDDQKQANDWLSRPYHFEHQLDVPPGQYEVKAALSPAPDTFGKAAAKIEIPAFDSGKLAMSAIALSRQLVNATGGMGGLPADMMDGPVPLLAGGRQIVPTAMTRFGKGERALFYTEIYEPSLAGKTPASVSMRFRVLERASGAVKSDSGVASVAGYVKAGNPVIGVASTVPTAKLAAGAYRLEITASHSSGPETVTRTVDFDLQ